ncbi:MAG TPA: histidine phosphatase family protein, partial [Polyangiaceae bacterium]
MSVALFIRHGKASAFSSSTDYDQLSPPGVEQSELLGTWLADEKVPADAVFVGPRKRHEQTYASVTRVLATRGVRLPEPVLLPDLDEHDGIALVFKVLPAVAAEDPELRDVVESIARNGKPSADDVLAAFKRLTRRWVRGEIGHPEVESWTAFRERVARAMDRIATVGRGRTALVFTSAGAVAAATAHSLGIADEERVLDLSWSLYNASVTELDFTGERWGMRTFNATPHLRD